MKKAVFLLLAVILAGFSMSTPLSAEDAPTAVSNAKANLQKHEAKAAAAAKKADEKAARKLKKAEEKARKEAEKAKRKAEKESGKAEKEIKKLKKGE